MTLSPQDKYRMTETTKLMLWAIVLGLSLTVFVAAIQDKTGGGVWEWFKTYPGIW